MQEGGGLAHGTHGTHGRIFGRGERRDRRTEKLTEGGGLAAKRRKGRKNRIDDGKADAGGRRVGPRNTWNTRKNFLQEGTERAEDGWGGGVGACKRCAI